LKPPAENYHGREWALKKLLVGAHDDFLRVITDGSAFNCQSLCLMTDKYCLVNWVFVDSIVIAMTRKAHDTGLFDVNISQWTPEKAWLGK